MRSSNRGALFLFACYLLFTIYSTSVENTKGLFSLTLRVTINLMKILGVDWGEKRIGLAIADDSLAEPLGVVSSIEELIEIAREKGVEKIVLGLPEGSHRKEVRELGKRLGKELGIEVIRWGEVLSTEAALKTAIEAGKGRKARRELDAPAAAILLQEYLDAAKAGS